MGLSPAEIIKAVCPDLSNSALLDTFLAMAAESLSAGFFGAMYNHAVAYKAAHLFTLMDAESGAASAIQNIGGGAPVASMSEGGLSVSFAQNAADDSALGSTKYGKMLLGIMKGRPTMGINSAGRSRF